MREGERKKKRREIRRPNIGGTVRREGQLVRGSKNPGPCPYVVMWSGGLGGRQGRHSFLIGRGSLGSVWHLFKHLEMFTTTTNLFLKAD